MARDIGSYFEKMTKRAEGGRRLETDGGDTAPRYEPADDVSNRSGGAGSSGGGLGDMLKDILGKGRTTATKTSKKATQKARERIRRRRSPKPVSTKTVGGDRRSKTLPPEGVVAVEYSPRIDGDPDPGEVVWTWVPFEEDPDQGKDRPVVVIGRRNRGLVGVPLTTKKNDREAQISIGTGDWDPKRRRSYARIWRMLDIDEDKTRREGAVLERDKFDDVIVAVDRYYDIHRPKRTDTTDDFDYDY